MNTTKATEKTDNNNTKLKGERRCNIYPDVWAAIYGCTGKATRWHHGIGAFGRAAIEYSCPTCYTAKVMMAAARKMFGPTFEQEMITLSQASVGVDDYRYAVTRREGGRPVLVRDSAGNVKTYGGIY